MTKCEYCGKKIGLLAVGYTWLDKQNNRAMHDKCYEKYMSESPEKRKQISEEKQEQNKITMDNESPLVKKKFELNSSIMAGILSFIFFMVEIFFIVFLIFENKFIIGFGDIIMIAGFLYIIHKTLWKKLKLTTWEWIGLAILIIWFIVAFIIGFIWGFLSAIE